MKPGDLVRLKPMQTATGLHIQTATGDIVVSWSRPVVGAGDVEESEDDETLYPVGTVAVFLDTKQRAGMQWNISWILLEGRVGWVWEEELEELPQEQS